MNSPAGWYQDPFAEGERYWDGSAWSSETRPAHVYPPADNHVGSPFEQGPSVRDQFTQDPHGQPAPFPQSPHDQYQEPFQQGSYSQAPYQEAPYQQDQYQQGAFQNDPNQQGSSQQGSFQQDQYQQKQFPQDTFQPAAGNEWMRIAREERQTLQPDAKGTGSKNTARSFMAKGPFGKKAIVGLVVVISITAGLASMNSKSGNQVVITGGIPVGQASTSDDTTPGATDDSDYYVVDETDTTTDNDAIGENTPSNDTSYGDDTAGGSNEPTPGTTSPTPKASVSAEPSVSPSAKPSVKPSVKSTTKATTPPVASKRAKAPDIVSTVWSQSTLIVSLVDAKQPSGVRITSNTVTVTSPTGRKHTVTTRDNVLNFPDTGKGCTVRVVTHTTAGDSSPLTTACSTRTL